MLIVISSLFLTSEWQQNLTFCVLVSVLLRNCYVSYGVLTEFLRMNVILIRTFATHNGDTATEERIRDAGNHALSSASLLPTSHQLLCRRQATACRMMRPFTANKLIDWRPSLVKPETCRRLCQWSRQNDWPTGRPSSDCGLMDGRWPAALPMQAITVEAWHPTAFGDPTHGIDWRLCVRFTPRRRLNFCVHCRSPWLPIRFRTAWRRLRWICPHLQLGRHLKTDHEWCSKS